MSPTYHPIAIDLETTGLDPWKHEIVLMSWWDGKREKGGVIRTLDGIRKFLHVTRHHPKLFWNAKFDLSFLQWDGIKVTSEVIDVMVLARLVSSDERSYGLKHLGGKYLHESGVEEHRLKAWMKRHKGKMHEAPDSLLVPYAIKDAEMTWDLHYVFQPLVDERTRKLMDMEMSVLRAVLDMEDRGFRVDRSYAQALREQVESERTVVLAKLKVMTGREDFKPLSVVHLRQLLYEELKVPVARRTPKGDPSTDRIALLDVPEGKAKRFADLLLDYRKLHKASTTYLKNFVERTDAFGVLRASFNQSGAKTGRFSSSGPNLQNIPRPGEGALGKVRNCITARKNHVLVFIDYDQVELRLAAHFANEKDMIQTILAGGDLHGLTATKIFGVSPDDPDFKTKRQISKTLNFAILYGVGPSTFRDTLLNDAEVRIPHAEATEVVANYKDAYPGVVRLFDEVHEQVRTKGWIENAYGRRMKVLKSKAYIGVNYLIQGTAADLMKRKLVVCHEFLDGWKSKLLGTIHDELVFEIHKDERHLVSCLKGIMEDHEHYRVPITCSVSLARKWGEKKEVKVRSSRWHLAG